MTANHLTDVISTEGNIGNPEWPEHWARHVRHIRATQWVQGTVRKPHCPEAPRIEEQIRKSDTLQYQKRHVSDSPPAHWLTHSRRAFFKARPFPDMSRPSLAKDPANIRKSDSKRDSFSFSKLFQPLFQVKTQQKPLEKDVPPPRLSPPHMVEPHSSFTGIPSPQSAIERWPNLPEEPSVQVRDELEVVLRRRDRCRRLDDEQRKGPWSG